MIEINIYTQDECCYNRERYIVQIVYSIYEVSKVEGEDSRDIQKSIIVCNQVRY